MSRVTKVLQDPTENVALHCKVQEYLIGQGKGRNDNTINNAWYSSKKHWNFVSRGLSVWKVYIWPNKLQALGMILLQNLFALFSCCLFKIWCCVCTDAFQILRCNLNEKYSGRRVRFWGWFVCLFQWSVSFTYSVKLVHTDISLICFLYTMGPRQSKTQMKCCIFPFTGN